ncbi:phage holin family protein [Citreimonas salinaria]|uniref:Putative Holin-X, holin superfamily III n=1 Tax=Citreimonas salinaria TaxID=321339 RepID=A0A1H3J5V6_9RHOB|nr:phage holin family protein [Citreimonas salinaria]SDY35321.1 Putative Holin-X, holin superfamily III [Citreimonas salinaria]
MSGPADFRETPSLLVKVLRQFSTLMQDELALARAEMSRNASRAMAGAAMIGVAAIIALVALNVLAAALVAWIAAEGLSFGVASLIVGGTLLVIAIVVGLIGKSRLSAKALSPTRTTRNVERDVETVREATHA